MQSGLFNIFASAVLKTCKAPAGLYSGEQLNEVVSWFPEPIETIKLMNYTVWDMPILFQDVGFQHIGPFFIDLMNRGEPMMPVFLVPHDVVWAIQEDPHFKTLEAHLGANDIAISLNITAERYMVRGEDVRVIDIRPRFLKGIAWEG
ncbi:hypothetical protein [Ancylobacter sp.]|uniref:hypothetical protein n=1 Tax=Ancylobacter sp. TaxID=1872567 RepID=UPI003C7E58CC